MKTLIILFAFVSAFEVQASSCMDRYFSKNITKPSQQLKRIGYGHLVGSGAAIPISLIGGISSFIPIFGVAAGSIFLSPALVKEGGQIRALRLIAQAEGKTDYYLSISPKNQFPMQVKEYFSHKRNEREFNRLYKKMNRVYRRTHKSDLKEQDLKEIIIRGNENGEFCESARKFKFKSVSRYVANVLRVQDVSSSDDSSSSDESSSSEE